MLLALLVNLVAGQGCSLPIINCPTCSGSPPQCSGPCPAPLLRIESLGCLPCYYKCSECSSPSPTDCTSCQDNYYISPTNVLKCQPCLLNCLSCDATLNCQRCAPGFYLLSGLCNECFYNNSLTCEFQRVLTCHGGFTPNQGGAVCSPCPLNCQTCSPALVCNGCMQGYALSISSSLCQNCTYRNCMSCLTTRCGNCIADNYYISTMGNCLLCAVNCATCSSTQCMSCNQGFTLMNGHCNTTSSVPNCLRQVSATCESCLGGFFLRANICQTQCSILCRSCNSPSPADCSTCQSSAYFSSNTCTPLLSFSETVAQQYFSYNYRQDVFAYSDGTAPSLLRCFGMQLNSNGKTVNINLGILQSYSVRIIGRLYWFADTAGNITVTLNSISQLVTVPASITYTSCPDSSMSYRALNFSLTFTQLIDTNTLSFEAGSNFTVDELLVQRSFCADPKCLLCLNALSCSKCVSSSMFIQGAVCKVICDSGFYSFRDINGINQCFLSCPSVTFANNLVGSCIACTNNCLSCASETTCLTCGPGYALFESTCLATCPQGYYADSSLFLCLACSFPCRNCTESKVNCLSCSSLFYYQNRCLQTCPAGFYSNIAQLTCTMCAVGCATCSSSNVCHSCTAAGGVAYFSHQSTCATTCPRFYFPSTATNICSPCVDECLECTSATVCTACRNKFLTAGQCQQNCPTGKYGLTSTMTCTDCPTGCLTCLNSQACSPPCAGNYAYDESAGQCTLNCPAGTYSGAFTPPAPGSSYARCLPCSINCLTCRVSPDNCTACSAGYLSTMGRAGTCSPVNVCQPGQYANTAELACQNCAGTCLTCLFSASFCISCREGMLLQVVAGQCMSTCASGYYPDSRVCRRCPRPCNTCSLFGTVLSCTTCITQFQLSAGSCVENCPSGTRPSGVCVPCIQGCLQCVNGSSCLKCGIAGVTQYFLNAATSTCVQACPSGMFGDGVASACKPCSSVCITCSLFDTCTSCRTDRLAYFGLCLGSCPSGSFKNGSVCQPCVEPCLSCASSTICLSCQPGQFFTRLLSNCTADCAMGYYRAVLSCEICSFPCAACTGTSFQCTSCEQGALLSSTCFLFCPGRFVRQGGVCQPCTAPCELCEGGPATCTSCQEGSFLNPASNTCGSCRGSEYSDATSRICFPCNQPCQSCTNAFICTSCQYGSLLEGQCLNLCPDRSFSSLESASNTLKCRSCEGDCVLCTGLASYCLTCTNTSLFPVNGDCNGSCPAGFYPDLLLKACSPCAISCDLCTFINACTKCRTGFLYNGQCISYCPAGFYQTESRECGACQVPCATCSHASNSCSSCVISLPDDPDDIYFIFGSTCYTTCPLGTLKNQAQKICFSCFRPCQTCRQQPSLCGTCIPGFLLLGQSCIPGSSCPNGLFLNTESSSCIDRSSCPPSYFINEVTSECSVFCGINYFGFQGKCVESCPPGTSKDEALNCAEGAANLLNFTAVLFIERNIMRGTITFNKEVTYLSSISNETLQVISGNSSFVENAARALQETAVQLPVSLMGFGERTINFRTFFNESLFFSNVSIRIVNSTQYIRAADTNRPVEQPHGVFAVPLYNFYQPSDRAIGQEFRLMSESITVVMLLLGLLMVLRNRLSEMYFILHYMQHLYLLIFLNLLYPPNLGSFLAGFKLAHLSFVPNLFGNVIPPGYRQNSPLPFFVNSYDISFIRSAGFDFTIVVGVLLFFIVCRLLEALFTAVAEKALPEALGPTAHENVTPQIEKEPEQTAVVVRDGPEEGQQEDEGRAEVAQKEGESPTQEDTKARIEQIRKGCKDIVVGFLKSMRLRLRWHHANDLMFLLQLNIMFFGFSQLKAPDVDTSFGIFSLVMAILAILAWLAWIFFILRKISKHKIRIIAGLLERNLTTFYQGMLPVSRLGVFFQFLFYCRRCMEAALIGLAGTLPLYVLPVLLLSSVFVILLILYYRPFLLPVHNFVTIAAEGILMVIYIIITVITYNDTYLTNRAKFALGWIAVVLGVFLILALCLFLVVKLVDPEFFDALSQDELEFKKEQLLNEENMRGKNELQNGDDDGDIDDESELNSDEESSVGYDFSRRGVDGFHRNFIHYSQSSDDENMQEVPRILIKCVKNPDYKEESQGDDFPQQLK